MATHSIDYKFITQLEGFKTKMYVPAASSSKSGPTIATGFDLGARNAQDLVNLGLSKSLRDRFAPYLGLQGMAAKRFVDKNPLTITTAEAHAINRAVKNKTATSLISKYNAAVSKKPGKLKFNELPPQAQTVIASVSFQYGDLPSRCPTFWRHVTNQDWKAAVGELRDFGDDYKTRRNKEADLLAEVLSGKPGAPTSPAAPGTSAPPKAQLTPNSIKGSVGSRAKGARNSKADVELVQKLLLGAGFDPKGIDGLIGPNTVNAIMAFQRTWWSNPDGLIEPGKTTIRKLIEAQKR